MKSLIPATLALVSLVAALPALDARTDRILPANWEFSIKSLKGPGCPDFANLASQTERTTRLTFGQNTVDGSEIYYWFVAYPYLRASLAGQTQSWCETELGYQEYADAGKKTPASDYRLRLHKNGTRVIATYDLEAQTKATFTFTYDAGNQKITDSIIWQGPLASGQYAQQDSSPASKKPELYKYPKCGTATIKFRTELSVEGKKGRKGVVDSEHATDKVGKEEYYGIQQGFSYDWEKCGY